MSEDLNQLADETNKAAGWFYNKVTEPKFAN